VIRILAFVLMCSVAPATAQTLKTSPWESRCETPYCVFQKTLEFVDGTAFAVVDVLIDIETGDASIIATAPLGVALEPGAMLSVGEQSWVLPFKVCQVDGCRATMELDSDAFTGLLEKTELRIRYTAFGADTPLEASMLVEKLVTAISMARP